MLITRQRRSRLILNAFFSWAQVRTPTRVRTQFRQGTIAFGPQHPAAHGILKLQLQLHGEVLRWIDPQFGFLHRGSEKLAEGRNVLQALPYFDRFDYVANLFQEHAYCLAVEGLHKQTAVMSTGLQLARLLFDEISRVLNHLLTLSATALDLSAMGPIFWAFEEREALMELCEHASGARMHTALYRPYQFDFSVFSGLFLREISQFLARCGRSLAGAFLGLLNNRGLKSRLSFVGQVALAKATAYGVSGLTGRSCGSLYDLRLQGRLGYTLYRSLAFRIFIGRRGDNLDRFLLRIKEVAEGFRVLSQCLQALLPTPGTLRQLPGAQLLVQKPHVRTTWAGRRAPWDLDLVSPCWVAADQARFVTRKVPTATNTGVLRVSTDLAWLETPTTFGKYSSMESLISHFRQASEGYVLRGGLMYAGVESPKGEVGVTLLGVGSARPYRLKMRTPVSHNMHLIPTVGVGSTFADFVATFCSLDIVMGEIDR